MESIERLWLEVSSSRMTRQDVLRRAMALGLTAPAIAMLLSACLGDDDDDSEEAEETPAGESDQVTEATVTEAGDAEATPTEAEEDEPAATATEEAETPETATEEATEEDAQTGGRGRGQGDLLSILYWQVPVLMNPHLAGGGAGGQISSLTIEPLVDFDPDGNLVPSLAAEVPSVENGGLAENGMSVTYKLREGVVWSDGEPFTAEDVRFTWEYIMHPEASSVTVAIYDPIADVEVVDEHTVTLHFKQPNPGWYAVFGGGFTGAVLPKHILQEYIGADAQEAPFNFIPIGTGPYKVVDFNPGDVALYEINENYREPDKPFFQRVELKGGGDATSTARAVLQTGDAHYTWFVTVEKELLDQMLGGDSVGELIVVDGPDVERIALNITNPSEVDGERSKLGEPHPFQSERAVREAFSFITNRDVVADELYGVLGKATANTLVAPEQFASPNTSYEFNVERAAQLLDDAGWTVVDGQRQKDGVQMSILYQTSTNALRQKNQEIIKEDLESIGIPVEIKAIAGGVFFSSDAGNPDTRSHFYADWEMWANGPDVPFPIAYMAIYKSTEPEIDIAQESNGWSGPNLYRWINEDYNTLYEQILTEFDPDRQAELFIAMNDLVVKEDIIELPQIHRTTVSAKNSSLKGNNLTPWTTDFWDIQNWYWEE